MKTILRHYTPIAVLLAVILLVSTLLSLWTAPPAADAEYTVLVTNYPLYLAAQNILENTDVVALTLLSGAGSGCLHDYQLSPADRLALERADKILTLGVGEEPFLEGVDENRLIRTATDQPLLCSHEEHHHDHGHTHEEAYNEHMWMSPARYSEMVLTTLDEMIALDPNGAAIYRENAANYLMSIDGVEGLFPNLTGRACVLFHDSLSYLAEDLGLDVRLTLSAEGESGLSAADLAQVEQLAKEHPDLILLYDTQYPIRYGAVDGLVDTHRVIALETAVVGEGKPSDWVNAMENNAKKLQQLTGGDTP